MTRLLSLSLFLGLAATAHALPSWIPLIGDDPEDLPPEEQDELAFPVFLAATEAQQAGRERRALDLFEDVWDDYPSSRYAPRALYQTARIRFEQQDWRDAFIAAQTVIGRYPDYPEFNQLVEMQFACAEASELGIGTRYLWIIRYRAYDQAVSFYEVLVRNAPFHPLAPQALMRVANIHRQRNDIPEAISAYDRMINNYPDHELTANAYLGLADTFSSLVDGPEYDQGATREAISYYQDFLILYPEAVSVGDGEEGLRAMNEVYANSKLVMGEFYYLRRNAFQAARVFFNEAITVAPESNAADRARAYLEEMDAIIAATPEGERPSASRQRGLFERLFFWR